MPIIYLIANKIISWHISYIEHTYAWVISALLVVEKKFCLRQSAQHSLAQKDCCHRVPSNSPTLSLSQTSPCYLYTTN